MSGAAFLQLILFSFHLPSAEPWQPASLLLSPAVIHTWLLNATCLRLSLRPEGHLHSPCAFPAAASRKRFGERRGQLACCERVSHRGRSSSWGEAVAFGTGVGSRAAICAESRPGTRLDFWPQHSWKVMGRESFVYVLTLFPYRV